MFESAEMGHKISKSVYAREVPKLREALLNAQLNLKKFGNFQVIILIGGVDGSGRGQTVKLLNEWMDTRYIETNAMSGATEEQLAHPPMWKFWNLLPPKGKISIFFGSWYTKSIIDRVYKRTKNSDLEKDMSNIVRFEKMLHDEGALILKFWFHLSKDAQKKRLKKLEKNPEKAWLVTPVEWEHYKHYDKFRDVSEHAIARTSTAEASWTIVGAADARYRYLTVGKVILAELNSRLNRKSKTTTIKTNLPVELPPVDGKKLLRALDYSQHVSKENYEKKLLKLQKKLSCLFHDLKRKRISTILVFEGTDAAGKGSTIRRVTGGLDPRVYRIVPTAAPNEEEKLHPYLWRFWRQIPRLGNLTIFDRSWYGRLLVERVEGFCSEADWKRAFSEINDFEEEVSQNDTLILKFWLSITKDEQLRRFKKRQTIAFKHFKITKEDWRNRKKWNEYEVAIEDMIDRTSTVYFPWTLVEANNKYFAHLKVLKTICDRIEAIL